MFSPDKIKSQEPKTRTEKIKTFNKSYVIYIRRDKNLRYITEYKK